MVTVGKDNMLTAQISFIYCNEYLEWKTCGDIQLLALREVDE